MNVLKLILIEFGVNYLYSINKWSNLLDMCERHQASILVTHNSNLLRLEIASVCCGFVYCFC